MLSALPVSLCEYCTMLGISLKLTLWYSRRLERNQTLLGGQLAGHRLDLSDIGQEQSCLCVVVSIADSRCIYLARAHDH